MPSERERERERKAGERERATKANKNRRKGGTVGSEARPTFPRVYIRSASTHTHTHAPVQGGEERRAAGDVGEADGERRDAAAAVSAAAGRGRAGGKGDEVQSLSRETRGEKERITPRRAT